MGANREGEGWQIVMAGLCVGFCPKRAILHPRLECWGVQGMDMETLSCVLTWFSTCSS